jgi:hypothetical protein
MSDQSKPADVKIHASDWAGFKELVRRGINTWDSAPPGIKVIADLITEGRAMQDYYSLANIPETVSVTKAINLPEPAPAPAPAPTKDLFTTQAQEFNAMYGLGEFPVQALIRSNVIERLDEFYKMLGEELSELQEIKEKITSRQYETPVDFLADLADFLGDMQVYCRSEMLRWQLPPQEILTIIMESNASKLGDDGLPIIRDGKVQKGPNYWRPEPKIKQLLIEMYTATKSV